MIGFLHTAAGHVAAFTDLVRALDPSVETRHAVHAELLSAAQDRGPTDGAVRAGVEQAIGALVGGGARMVVCTCSTIGDVAERVAIPPGVTVMRVDRPMAERAVALGPRVAVVAAIAVTLAPTRALLQAVAERAGRSVEISDVPCPQAWTRF